MKLTDWRRHQVLELSSKGYSQSEISKKLEINKSTISKDCAYLREQSKQNIRKYIDEKLPEEYEKCLVGLTSILKEAWNTAQQSQDKREKIQALSLAKDCYSMKLELLTNATVVDDAMRFVSANAKKIKQYKDTTIKDAREVKAEDIGGADYDNKGSNNSYNITF